MWRMPKISGPARENYSIMVEAEMYFEFRLIEAWFLRGGFPTGHHLIVPCLYLEWMAFHTQQ